MKVAIDGPASSGKSTVAKALARRLGFTYLDTGAMYRACALRCERHHIDFSDLDVLTECVKDIQITFGPFTDKTQVFLNGEDVSDAIHTAQVDKDVSVVSGIQAIRDQMVALQRKLGSEGNVVVEGRDIGSVVFPDAEVKVFLIATADARAHRRAVERAGGDTATGKTAQVNPDEEQAILKDIERRDKVDSSRASFKLEPAPGAVTIDSSDLSVEQVVDQIEELVKKAQTVSKPATEREAETVSQPSSNTKPQASKPSSAEKKPETSSKPAPIRRAKRDTRSTFEPMKSFGHYKIKDYYDHGMKEFPLGSRAFLAISENATWLYTKIVFPWKVEQAEKFWKGWKPGSTGRVLVMNHVSMLDPVILSMLLYHHGIRIHPISKSEFDKNRFVSWAFSRYGCIPVHRGTADLKAIRHARDALKKGDWILVFPEGTRIKSDDQPVTIHGGFALMAQLANATVQPVAIVGARDITPKGTHFPRPRRVFLKVGDEIHFEDLGIEKKHDQVDAMEKLAMDKVYELRAELRKEHPGKM